MRRIPPWVWIGVAICLLRIPSFIRPLLDDDEAQYAAIGELVRAGGRLYADGGVDFKFPGIYWTYAAIFAVAGRYAMWAVHLVALGVVLATSAILARIARAGVAAALFYGVFSTVYYDKMLAANTEIFMTLGISAAVFLLGRDERSLGRALAAGALIGLACLYKQVSIVSMVLPLFGRRPIARTLAAGVGWELAPAAGALLLHATGSFAGLWHWSIERLVGNYGSSAWRGSLAGNLARGFLPFVGASLVVWVGAAVGVAQGAPRLVLAWLGVSLISAAAGGHFFAHYLIQPLAPLAVLAALGLRQFGRLAAAATALPALGCFALGFVFEPITESFGAPDPDFREPVAWVRAHTGPDDRIFVWGVFPAMYVLTERLPASRFVGFMRGAERSRNVPPEAGWDVGPEVWPALAEDFAAHPPALVVDTTSADYNSSGHYPMSRFPAVQALVDRDYVRAAAPGGVVVYTRRR